MKRGCGLTQAYINGLWETLEKPVSCFYNTYITWPHKCAFQYLWYKIQIIEFIDSFNELLSEVLLSSDSETLQVSGIADSHRWLDEFMVAYCRIVTLSPIAAKSH